MQCNNQHYVHGVSSLSYTRLSIYMYTVRTCKGCLVWFAWDLQQYIHRKRSIYSLLLYEQLLSPPSPHNEGHPTQSRPMVQWDGTDGIAMTTRTVGTFGIVNVPMDNRWQLILMLDMCDWTAKCVDWTQACTSPCLPTWQQLGKCRLVRYLSKSAHKETPV